MEKLYELKRGKENVIIHTMAFNDSSDLLSLFSAHGTLHFFPILFDYNDKQLDEKQVSDYSKKR